MSIVDDFSSIGARLSEIEKKIPKPESDTANPLAETISQTWMERQVVWTPEDGYVTREPEQVVCLNVQPLVVATHAGFDWAAWRAAVAEAHKELRKIQSFGNFINAKI